MQISKDTLAGRTIVAAVYVAVIALLATGIFLGRVDRPRDERRRHGPVQRATDGHRTDGQGPGRA